MDERTLEQAMRRGLRERAAYADTSAPARERVAAVKSRRIGAWVAVVAAAAAVVVVVATGVVLAGGDGPSRNGEPLVDSPGTTAWRTEYWHDMKVDVPADWGYGGAPARSAGETVACWPTAMYDADGQRIRKDDPTLPYVGRPIAMTDLCQRYPFNMPDHLPPKAPYVWLGADVGLGSEDLGEGWVQQTIEVNGSRLTVASDDAELRQRIIDSAEGGELCYANQDITGQGMKLGPDGPTPEAREFTICGYHQEGRSTWLTYAVTLGEQHADRFLAAYRDGAALPDSQQCRDRGPEFEWVSLEAKGRSYVVSFPAGCAQVEGPDGAVRLTPEMARTFAVGGVPTVIYGPTGGRGAMLESFLGQLG